MKKILFGLIFITTLLIPAQLFAQEGASPSGTAQDIVNFFNQLIQITDPVNVTIKQPTPNIETWSFFRSFINYILAVMLIIAAFSTVTPFGTLDNYTIKKVLPNLILGFILANLSLFICQTILDFSESIVTTLQQIGGGAGTEGAIRGIFSSLGTALTAILAVLIPAVTIGGPFGLILGVIFIFILLAFPVVIQIAFLLIFAIRHLVVQFLVVVSPVAFMALGTTFTRKLFQNWWNLFLTWTFLKPIGWGLLVLGGLIISSDFGGDLIGFLAGMAAMVAAITIPFKAGGAINSSLLDFAKFTGDSSRRGLASFAQRASGSDNRILRGAGQIAGGVAGLAYSGEAIKGKLDKQKSLSQAAGLSRAARLAGDYRQAASVQDKLIGDKRAELKSYSNDELFSSFATENLTPEERAAHLLEAEERKQTKKMYKNYNEVKELKPGDKGYIDLTDELQQKKREVEFLGGSVGKDGEIKGDLAVRIGGQLDDSAKKSGIFMRGLRQKFNPKTKSSYLAKEEDQLALAQGLLSGDPAMTARNATEKAWTISRVTGKDKDGKDITQLELNKGVIHAIKEDALNKEFFEQDRMSNDLLSAVRANNSVVQDQLKKEIEAIRNAATTAGRTLTSKEQLAIRNLQAAKLRFRQGSSGETVKSSPVYDSSRPV